MCHCGSYASRDTITKIVVVGASLVPLRLDEVADVLFFSSGNGFGWLKIMLLHVLNLTCVLIKEILEVGREVVGIERTVITIAEDVVGALVAADDDESLVESAIEHIEISIVFWCECRGGFISFVGQGEQLLDLWVSLVDKGSCLLCGYLTTDLLCADSYCSKQYGSYENIKSFHIIKKFRVSSF